MVANAAKLLLTGDANDLIKDLKKVVQGQQKIVDKLKQTGKASRKLGTQSRKDVGKMGTAFQGLDKNIRGVIGRFAGAAGLGAVMGSFISATQEAARETVKFEDDITDLLSLGDNVRNIAAIKKEIKGMSEAFGIAKSEVAGAMFDIQSGAGNASKEIKRSLINTALLLTSVTSTELVDATKLMIKTWNIFGSSLKSPTQAMSKLFAISEKGFINFKQLAIELPKVASGAEAMGISLDELGAAIVITTQTSGSIAETFTGLKAIVFGMTRAIDAGLTSRKSFIEQLKDLEKIDPDKLKASFGDAAITPLLALKANIPGVVLALKELKQVSEDIALQKFAERFKDPDFLFARTQKSVQQILKNQRLEAGDLSIAQQFDFARVGAQQVIPPRFRNEVTVTAAAIGELIVANIFEPLTGLLGAPKRTGPTFGTIGLQETINRTRAGAPIGSRAGQVEPSALEKTFQGIEPLIPIPELEPAKPTNAPSGGVRATPGDTDAEAAQKGQEMVDILKRGSRRKQSNTNNLTE